MIPRELVWRFWEVLNSRLSWKLDSCSEASEHPLKQTREHSERANVCQARVPNIKKSLQNYPGSASWSGSRPKLIPCFLFKAYPSKNIHKKQWLFEVLFPDNPNNLLLWSLISSVHVQKYSHGTDLLILQSAVRRKNSISTHTKSILYFNLT